MLTFNAPWVGYEPPQAMMATATSLLGSLRRLRAEEAFVLTSYHQSPLPLALLLRLAGVERISAALCAATPAASCLAGRVDLAGLGRLLCGADALVCGNTGPAHLAAAVGTPVVSVFAPTVELKRWRPWRVPHIVLGDQKIGCRGCRARTCPLPAQPCVARVRGGDIAAAVDAITAVDPLVSASERIGR